MDIARIISVAGTGQPGYAGDGGPAVQASLNGPFDMAFDRAWNMFFSDTFDHCIRRVDALTGVIATVAGTGHPGYSGDGGPAIRACLNEPYGVALDRAGNLFIVDRLNRCVRRVDAGSGAIATLIAEPLVEPNDICLDPAGRRLFVADVADHRVRVVDLTTGRIGTAAGTGEARHDGDGGPAVAAALHGPSAVAFGQDGALLILERNGNTTAPGRSGQRSDRHHRGYRGAGLSAPCRTPSTTAR